MNNEEGKIYYGLGLDNIDDNISNMGRNIASLKTSIDDIALKGITIKK